MAIASIRVAAAILASQPSIAQQKLLNATATLVRMVDSAKIMLMATTVPVPQVKGLDAIY